MLLFIWNVQMQQFFFLFRSYYAIHTPHTPISIIVHFILIYIKFNTLNLRVFRKTNTKIHVRFIHRVDHNTTISRRSINDDPNKYNKNKNDLITNIFMHQFKLIITFLIEEKN